jgi:hypothetical protein
LCSFLLINLFFIDSYNIFFILAGTPALIIFSFLFNAAGTPASFSCLFPAGRQLLNFAGISGYILRTVLSEPLDGKLCLPGTLTACGQRKFNSIAAGDPYRQTRTVQYGNFNLP